MSQPPRRRVPPLFFAAGGLTVLILVTGVLMRSSGPVLWDDEGTYLWVAVGFARFDVWTQIDGSNLYSATYSLLLVPFVWALGESRAFEAALALNLAAGAAAVAAGYRLATDALELERRDAALAVFAAGAYPPAAMEFYRAWPEFILMALVLLFALWTYRYLDRPSIRTMMPLIATASLSYGVHKRTIGLLAVAVLIPLLAERIRRSDRIRHGSVALLGAIMGYVGAAALDSVSDRSTSSLSRQTHVAGAINPDQWLGVLTAALGQFWSLQVGTLGLAVVAVVGGFVTFEEAGRRRWYVALVGSLVATMAISAAFLRTSPAVDHVLYTRYLDVFGPLLVLLGAAVLLRAPSLAAQWWIRGVLGTIIAIGFVRQFRLDSFTSPIVKLRIPGLLGPNALVRDFGEKVTLTIEAAAISAWLTLFVVIMVLLLRSDRARIAVFSVASASAVLAVLAAGWSLGPWLNITEGTGASAADLLVEQDQVTLTVVASGEAREVARAIAYESDYRIEPQSMLRSDAEAGVCPTSRFVLSEPDVVLGFETKQVGDGAPFKALLLEVIGCEADS